jgi:beta-lactamase class A
MDRTPEPAPAPAESAAGPATVPVEDTVLAGTLRVLVEEVEGSVGVAVLHLQRGVKVRIDADLPFPLASVYKFPIAYAALQRPDVAPGDTVEVTAADRAPGATPLSIGDEVTLVDLLHRSLGRSDNTASDVLLRLAGGPAGVSRRLADLGIHGVRVDRTMGEIFVDWRADAAGFLEDSRDTGTAAGLVSLLASLHRGEGLGAAARAALLEGLRAAETGPNRIRAGVPPGTVVAHKTGTLGPLTHDVGLVALPPGSGDVALAVLVRSETPLAVREGLIAAVARAVWERFAGLPGAVAPDSQPRPVSPA